MVDILGNLRVRGASPQHGGYYLKYEPVIGVKVAKVAKVAERVKVVKRAEVAKVFFKNRLVETPLCGVFHRKNRLSSFFHTYHFKIF